MKKVELFLIIGILLGAFIVRLYRFDNPIADWHSWRQADTSAVSRNFVTKGFDLLHPRFDDLSNVPSGFDNPQGYRFVEFPIYNAFQALLFRLFGILTLEEWGRLLTIIGSVVSTLFLYLLAKKHISKTAAFFTAFFYAFIPYNIYYGRVILPDPSMVSAVLGGTYFFDKWLEENTKGKAKKSIRKEIFFYIIAFLFIAESLLFKPYAAFFLLPLVYLSYKSFGLGLVKKWQLWMFFIFSFIPLTLWRFWMTQYPEGIPVNAWLLNGNGIRFRPAFFRWIVYERIAKLIAGYFGIGLLLIGLYKTWNVKERGFLLSFLLSSVLYVTIFATGNVQHDYYQILIMPTVALFLGVGAAVLLGDSKKIVTVQRIVLILLTFGSFYFGWGIVKDYFNINNRAIVTAGMAVDKLTPKDAKVIAPYVGDTSFLYHTKRQGWASMEKSLPEMIEMGASYLVQLNPTENDYKGLGSTYKIVSATKEYILFDLKNKP